MFTNTDDNDNDMFDSGEAIGEVFDDQIIDCGTAFILTGLSATPTYNCIQ